MRIEKTKATNHYITKAGREKFDFLEWIGLVVLDDGREGQLAKNTETDRYICLFNTDAYERLDTAAVEDALSVAIDRRPGRKPQPATPKVSATMIYARPMRHYMLSLPDELADLARTMGEGNLSAGVRACIKIATGLPVDDKP